MRAGLTVMIGVKARGEEAAAWRGAAAAEGRVLSDWVRRALDAAVAGRVGAEEGASREAVGSVVNVVVEPADRGGVAREVAAEGRRQEHGMYAAAVAQAEREEEG